MVKIRDYQKAWVSISSIVEIVKSVQVVAQIALANTTYYVYKNGKHDV